MITFDNWTIKAGGLIARQFDNLSRRIDIEGDIPDGWTWALLTQCGDQLNIITLTEADGGLYAVLTAEMLAAAGYYRLQLRGTRGETVRHTNAITAHIPASLSGDVQWPEVPSEFSQAEARIAALNAHPPIPGDAGSWLVWDLETDEYVQSELPLPDVAVGPPGPAGEAATVTVIGTETLAHGEPARVENVGTSEAAKLKFYIPAGQNGAPGTPGQSGAPGQDGAPGQAATIQVGTVTDGDTAAVTNSGTENAAILNFTLPRGEQGEPGPAGAGVPSTEGVPESYVLTPGGWAAPTGGDGEKEWKLLNQVSLSEPVRTVTIDTDADSIPFEVSELLVRAWLTCGEASKKKANIGVNGSSQNLAGNLDIIKNTGYFGPCEIHIFEECGLFKAEVAYTDAASPNDPPALNQYITAQRAIMLYTLPSVAYDKIRSFGIMCTDTAVTFSEKCLIQVYGR